MKFDVVITNPPYASRDGGGRNGASPVYDSFFYLGKQLAGRYVIMIIPSRFFVGGRNLYEFRDEFLHDKHVSTIVDYMDSNKMFKGTEIVGGVNYFVWDSEYNGDCTIVNKYGRVPDTAQLRRLDEFPILIRDNNSISIFRKIVAMVAEYGSMYDLVGFRGAGFGVASNYDVLERDENSIDVITARGVRYIHRGDIRDTTKLDKYNCCIPTTYTEHSDDYSRGKLLKVFSKSTTILHPGCACSESYYAIGAFDSEGVASNCLTYIRTKFVRFILFQFMLQVSNSKENFQYVPLVDFERTYTDEELYRMARLTNQEIEYIESCIDVY